MWRQVISFTLKRRHSFVQSKYYVPLIVAWFHTYIHPTPRILTFALVSQWTIWSRSSCCVNSSKLRKTSKNCNVLITFSGVDTSDFGQPQPLQRHLMHRSEIQYSLICRWCTSCETTFSTGGLYKKPINDCTCCIELHWWRDVGESLDSCPESSEPKVEWKYMF